MEETKHLNLPFSVALEYINDIKGYDVATCGAKSLAAALDTFGKNSGDISAFKINDVKAAFSYITNGLIHYVTNRYGDDIALLAEELQKILSEESMQKILEYNKTNLLRIHSALGKNKRKPDFEYFDPARAAFDKKKATELAAKLYTHPDFKMFLREWDAAASFSDEKERFTKKTELLLNPEYGLCMLFNDIFKHNHSAVMIEPIENSFSMYCRQDLQPNIPKQIYAELVINPTQELLSCSAVSIASALAHEHHHMDQSYDIKNKQDLFLNLNSFFGSLKNGLSLNYFGKLDEMDAYYFGNCFADELGRLAEQDTQKRNLSSFVTKSNSYVRTR